MHYGLTSGQILYKGKDIANLKGADMLEYRRQVQAVFQDPYEVYNPFYRVKHIYDMVVSHLHLAANKAEERELIEQSLRVTFGAIVALASVTYLHVVFGELAPKSLAIVGAILAFTLAGAVLVTTRSAWVMWPPPVR